MDRRYLKPRNLHPPKPVKSERTRFSDSKTSKSYDLITLFVASRGISLDLS